MLAKEMIQHAAHKAGLGTSTKTSAEVLAFGFKAINRAWLWVWEQYPHRGAKIPEFTVSTEEATLVLPPYVDCVRSMRHAQGAMFPLNEVIAADHGMEDWLAGMQPCRWINLPDAACPKHPLALRAEAEAAAQTLLGGTLPLTATKTFTLGLSMVYPDATAPTVRIEDRSGVRLTLTNGMDAEPLEDLGEIGMIYCSARVFKMVLTLTLTVTDGGETIAEVTRTFAECYNSDRTAYRAVRLVPAPTEGNPVTFHVTALRRFAALMDDDSAITLPDCESAVFGFLMAEMREFNDEDDRAGIDRQKATVELAAVIKRADEGTGDREDNCAYPVDSMFGE